MTLSPLGFPSVPRSAFWGSAAVATAVCLRSLGGDATGDEGASLGNWFGSRIDGHTRFLSSRST